MNRLTVMLTPDEMDALRNAANQNLRHPRNELKFRLLQSLGLLETHQVALAPEMQTGQGEPSLLGDNPA